MNQAEEDALIKECCPFEGFKPRWADIRLAIRAAVAAERERDRYKREHEADKTGQLISYLNVLAQENKTLRRMSHVDRAEKAERERDEWKRKAEENARDAARWKVCLDAEGVAVSIFNCDPASWRYPEGDQLVAAIDAIRTGADNAWSVPIHKCEPVHDESPPHDAAIAAKGEA